MPFIRDSHLLLNSLHFTNLHLSVYLLLLYSSYVWWFLISLSFYKVSPYPFHFFSFLFFIYFYFYFFSQRHPEGKGIIYIGNQTAAEDYNYLKWATLPSPSLTMLLCLAQCTVLWCDVLYCTVLYCTVLFFSVLCLALHFPLLSISLSVWCILLYYTLLYSA